MTEKRVPDKESQVSEPRRRGRKPLPRESPCGRFKREFCERGLAGLLEGARSDRSAMRRVGRQNSAILQCLEERSLPACDQCAHYPCVLQANVDHICPATRAQDKDRSWRLIALSPRGEVSSDAEGAMRPHGRVPDRSVSRLRWYLAALEAFREAGIKVVSSTDIGAKVGVSPSLVRRDLCYFGQFGTPSRGYHVNELLKGILTVFEVVRERWVAWVGADRLRRTPTCWSNSPATIGKSPPSSIPIPRSRAARSRGCACWTCQNSARSAGDWR